MTTAHSKDAPHIGVGRPGAPPAPLPRAPEGVLARAWARSQRVHAHLLELEATRDLPLPELLDPTSSTAPHLFEALCFLDAHASHRVTPLAALLMHAWLQRASPASLLSPLLIAWDLVLTTDTFDLARGPGGRFWVESAPRSRFETRTTSRLHTHPRPALCALRHLRAALATCDEASALAFRIEALERAPELSPERALILAYLLPDEPTFFGLAYEMVSALSTPSLLLLTTALPEALRVRLVEEHLTPALTHRLGTGPDGPMQGPLEVQVSPELWLASWVLPDALTLESQPESMLTALERHEVERGVPFTLGDVTLTLHHPPPVVGLASLPDLAGSKAPVWVVPGELPELALSDGAGVLSVEAAAACLGVLRKGRGEAPEGWPAFERVSLERWLGAVLGQWRRNSAQLTEDWCLRALILAGGDGVARILLSELPEWPGTGLGGHALRALEIACGVWGPERSETPDVGLRVLAEIARRAPSLASAMDAHLSRLAEAWGLSEDVCAERREPALGLEEREAWRFDYGARSFRLELDARLRPAIRTRRGGTRTTLPWVDARDAWDLARDERARFKRLQRELAQRAQPILERFERALRDRRRWEPERFREDILGHPLHRAVAEGLVWTCYDAAGAPVGVLDEVSQAWPEGASCVGLWHPLEALAAPPESSVVEPIRQRSRRFPEGAPVLEGAWVSAESLRGLERWGWRWESSVDLAWEPASGMRACVCLEAAPGRGSRCRVKAVAIAIGRAEPVFEAEVHRDLAALLRAAE